MRILTNSQTHLPDDSEFLIKRLTLLGELAQKNEKVIFRELKNKRILQTVFQVNFKSLCAWKQEIDNHDLFLVTETGFTREVHEINHKPRYVFVQKENTVAIYFLGQSKADFILKEEIPNFSEKITHSDVPERLIFEQHGFLFIQLLNEIGFFEGLETAMSTDQEALQETIEKINNQLKNYEGTILKKKSTPKKFPELEKVFNLSYMQKTIPEIHQLLAFCIDNMDALLKTRDGTELFMDVLATIGELDKNLSNEVTKKYNLKTWINCRTPIYHALDDQGSLEALTKIMEQVSADISLSNALKSDCHSHQMVFDQISEKTSFIAPDFAAISSLDKILVTTIYSNLAPVRESLIMRVDRLLCFIEKIQHLDLSSLDEMTRKLVFQMCIKKVGQVSTTFPNDYDFISYQSFPHLSEEDLLKFKAFACLNPAVLDFLSSVRTMRGKLAHMGGKISQQEITGMIHEITSESTTHLLLALQAALRKSVMSDSESKVSMFFSRIPEETLPKPTHFVQAVPFTCSNLPEISDACVQQKAANSLDSSGSQGPLPSDIDPQGPHKNGFTIRG